MKAILVPIMMLLLMLQSFGKWILLAEYQLNRDYIAKNLCENRSRPQMKCNGRCQLMKKWAAEDKAAAEGRAGKVKLEEIALPLQVTLAFTAPNAATVAHYEHYQRSCTDPDARPLLRPPLG